MLYNDIDWLVHRIRAFSKRKKSINLLRCVDVLNWNFKILKQNAKNKKFNNILHCDGVRRDS